MLVAAMVFGGSKHPIDELENKAVDLDQLITLTYIATTCLADENKTSLRGGRRIT
jgi:hypothetical protein